MPSFLLIINLVVYLEKKVKSSLLPLPFPLHDEMWIVMNEILQLYIKWVADLEVG